ncbi:aminopeptidase P family protein [Roseomonas sp. M0104]|uniref:Aminopeptidase P family protein n=1 Tax=Teichococcus coralli TaxID=2545983 RepID=A0A845B900_9PROT|nr:aminopeptidase P family protein [Pseudoroseomonas coralli]MXP62586.1 aminopeptidase P family protein [Pseudoroseomonas coralli]
MLTEVTHAKRLAALRAELARLDIDGLLVPRSDEYLGEYVPPSAERLAWLTGFTGSAGMAIVLAERAAVFTDGRYTTQVASQTDPALWERLHIIEQPAQEWLAEHAAGRSIGYDPWLHAQAAVERLAASGVRLVPLAANPLDAVWHDRPAAPRTQAMPQPAEFAGQGSAEKRAELAAALRQAGEDTAVLADPHSLAWLLNIRGADLEYTPLALGFALLHSNATVDLFMEPSKVPEATRAHLGNAVVVHPPVGLPTILAGLAGQAVRLDPESTPAWFAATLREAGATLRPGEDPCRLPRACKNPVEQAGARAAHRRDAVAMARFLAWFTAEAPRGGVTEMSAADRLLAFRREVPMFRAESFPAISGAGENGAIVHYRATEATNRAVRVNECYLVDSGGQYTDGTTDITRTLWTGPGTPPADLVERYTRVLRGHVALATLRFPQGVAGPHIDAVARAPLWEAGLDYDHGTGHGIGSFLSVHEGPVSISRAARPIPVRAGMILSDEPGYYQPGAYGIRIENLLLARPAAEQPGQVKPFLEFETLTLVPYERRLIGVALLTPAERAWVDAYHARVLAEVGEKVEPAVRDWLAEACAPL